jgi:hypothetical protein
MTELQDETAGVRTAANGKRTREAAEEARNAALEASDTAVEDMRKGQDATIDAFQRWTDRVAGMPITLLSGDAAAVLSGKVWVDDAFDATETLLAAQRQYLDHFLANQRHVATKLLETNFALLKGMWQVTRVTRDTDGN